MSEGKKLLNSFLDISTNRIIVKYSNNKVRLFQRKDIKSVHFYFCSATRITDYEEKPDMVFDLSNNPEKNDYGIFEFIYISDIEQHEDGILKLKIHLNH